MHLVVAMTPPTLFAQVQTELERYPDEIVSLVQTWIRSLPPEDPRRVPFRALLPNPLKIMFLNLTANGRPMTDHRQDALNLIRDIEEGRITQVVQLLDRIPPDLWEFNHLILQESGQRHVLTRANA